MCMCLDLGSGSALVGTLIAVTGVTMCATIGVGTFKDIVEAIENVCSVGEKTICVQCASEGRIRGGFA